MSVSPHRFQHELVQSGAARLLYMREQRPPHPRIPEPADVHRGAAQPLGPIRKAPMELPDLVGHLNQNRRIRHEVIRCSSSASCSSVNCWNRFCHSDDRNTGITCTAVTLYSGQLVAQSEFSVVITLAPDSGWWNVV